MARNAKSDSRGERRSGGRTGKRQWFKFAVTVFGRHRDYTTEVVDFEQSAVVGEAISRAKRLKGFSDHDIMNVDVQCLGLEGSW